MGNYVTEAEVRDYKISGNVVCLADYSSAQIESEIALSEEIVESITNDIFYVKTETSLFDGTGHDRLFYFPEIPYQNITITALLELDLDGTTVLDTFVANVDYKRYEFHIDTAQSFDGDSPRRRFGTGGTWPKGQKNISVAGTWGRATTPAAIVRAVMLLTLEGLAPNSTSMMSADINEAGWDDFTIKFQKGADIEVGQTTGYPVVDRLLSKHVNHISMFQVIPEDRQIFEHPPTNS